MKSKEEHIEAAKKVKFIPAKDHGQKQPMRGYDNPNSHMIGWPIQRRMDEWAYPLIEIFCKHGCGHPMPESVEWCELQGKKMMDRHGCCGCCIPPRSLSRRTNLQREPMGIKILYHDKCFDGFTAAWAAWKRFGDTAEYIPVSYGQAPYANTTDQDDVYLLDFCYPAHVLRTLSASKLVILDHHKTAEANLELMKFKPQDEVIFDMERSGAGIAWDYFFMEPRPKLVNYAEDHDLRRYNLPFSRYIRAYMHSYEYSFTAWNTLASMLENQFNNCTDMGYAINQFMKQQVKTICDQAELQLVGGIMVPVVNATSMWSEVGEELNLRYPEARFSAYWHILADGSKKWGLRTKHQDFDVSEVAQLFGGGGHRGAAGWVAPNGD